MRNYMYVLFIYRNHVIENHFRSSDRVKEVSPFTVHSTLPFSPQELLHDLSEGLRMEVGHDVREWST